ncbi:hypothetical protein QVD17_16002 [Tagetes erecta]|uniref:Terpene synthase metal-binding domain-containing protein n=1 Tax=Tagetes erecta TaxID=13708 RepID=A0AAD8KQ62_TARER|nr:hypothetical protein QVD17_16002 [Tagetes erecta]
MQKTKERNHFPSIVECYMKQHEATEEEAIDFVRNQIEDVWKDINHESLVCKHIPRTLIMVVINSSRTIEFLYKNNDNYTDAGEEFNEHMKSLFVHPLSI